MKDESFGDEQQLETMTLIKHYVWLSKGRLQDYQAQFSKNVGWDYDTPKPSESLHYLNTYWPSRANASVRAWKEEDYYNFLFLILSPWDNLMLTLLQRAYDY